MRHQVDQPQPLPWPLSSPKSRPLPLPLPRPLPSPLSRDFLGAFDSLVHISDWQRPWRGQWQRAWPRRWRWQRQGLVAKIVALAAGVLIWLSNIFPATAADLGNEAQHAAGKQVYEKHCGQCHGDKGDGLGYAAAFLRPAPRDFTSGKYKIRHTRSGELPLDADIHNAIFRGLAFRGDGAYTAMPPWLRLSNEDMANLVYYLKGFSKDFANDQYNNPKKVEIPTPPAYTAESATRGREVFEKNECIKCHGVLGRGDGPSAPTLKDDWGVHIRPADLTKRFAFRGGGTPEDIFRTVTTGLNGTPMPAYEDSVPVPARWDLVNYILSLSDRDLPGYNQQDKPIVVPFAKSEIDITDPKKAAEFFKDAAPAFIPVIGQVIEPGREFFPGINELQVRGIYSANEVALMVQWHDLRADKTGSNSPGTEVKEEPPQLPTKAAPKAESEDPFAEEEAAADPFAEEEAAPSFSDAILVQIPQALSSGFQMPYFLFGDSKNPVELWFRDLAKEKGELWTGKGSTAVSSTNKEITSSASFDNGEWTVFFKRPRKAEAGIEFQEKTFVPVAFSVWDGFNGERGNKRGVTAWFQLYLEPAEKPSVVGPMVLYAAVVLIIEALIIYVVRRRHRKNLR